MSEKIGITTIADRYAEAMLAIAEEKQCLDFVKNDLVTVSAIITDNEDLRKFIEHPLIPTKDKKEVLETLFTNKISPYVINLIKLLLDRHRMFIFKAISESFIKIFNKKFNIVVADVVTAVEIDESIKNAIQQKLSEIFSKTIQIKSKIDPKIIGGVIIKVEDQIINGSIVERLESIKKHLI